MAAPAEMKAPRTRLEEAKEAEKNATLEVTRARKKLKEVMTLRETLTRQIRSVTESEVIISEHAMLRYLERVIGLDIDELQERILPNSLRERASWIGSGRMCHGGIELVLKDNVVVTVLTTDTKKSGNGKKVKQRSARRTLKRTNIDG